ncbi:MAG: serine/threonine-protein phosphatase [Leptospiraceae bacterium]|nr:serine/threonine-protein phosphatase [Leptospiraceae bacterium]
MSFFIADASGHGISAALLTTLCKITIRDTVLKNSEPATALMEINQRLTNVLRPHNYITLFLFTLSASGKLKFANAGHNAVFLFRRKFASLETLSAKGGFLGIQLHKNAFEQKEVQIQKGDRILLFTDGFAHLLNIRKARQQIEILKDIFLQNQKENLQESFERILQDWSSYNSDKKEDDVTFVMIEYTGIV